jgi:hypothetical protein
MTLVIVSANAQNQKKLTMDSSSMMMLGPVVALYAGPGYAGTLSNNGRSGGFG